MYYGGKSYIKLRRIKRMAKRNNKKIKLQSLIFDKNFYPTKNSIKSWIHKNDLKIDNRLKIPILKHNNTFRVRQRNPDWFNKKTFKVESLGKGIKGVYGFLKI